MTTTIDKFDWIGTIETVTGVAFDVMNPEPGSVNLTDVAWSISKICRYNGHVPSFYSVAEHSVRVAWWLAERDESPEVVLTGLLHDASEAYVGDMVRPLKRHPEFGTIHQQIETKVAAAVHAALGGIFPHPDSVHDADRAVYEWEVDHIRSGATTGWAVDVACDHFLLAYEDLLDRLAR
jgi:uncharacterized protein